MKCTTCDSFPAPTSKFEELGISVERHSTLHKCRDCGHLVEVIAEERLSRYPGLSESLSNYFYSQFWPISVPQLYCKSCGETIDLEAAIQDSPYSWPNLSAFWHECLDCSTGNHVQVKQGEASIIEITGAPGPTWVALSRTQNEGFNVREDPEFLQVWLGNIHRAIPSRK